MSEIKKLSDDELGNVNGGCGKDPTEEDPHYPGYSGFVNKYNLNINSNYYFVHVQNREWFYGTVLGSYEKGHTRMHLVQLINQEHPGYSTWNNGETSEISGDWYAVYTSKTN